MKRFFRIFVLFISFFTLSTSISACSTEKDDPVVQDPVEDPKDDNGDDKQDTPEPEPQPEPEPEPTPEPSLLTVDMVYDALGLGWNLGNQLDAHNNGISGETFWGNPMVNQNLFDAIAKAGFKSVRIPVTWMGHIGPAPDYIIQSQWIDRVAEIVDYAEKAGLTSIINIHHDGADSNYWLDIKNAALNDATNVRIEAEIAALWSQIAERFADKGETLIFESMNEIHDGGWGWGANRTDGGKQYRTFNHWQQVFVDAVRKTGGKNSDRWLIVPTYCTNIDMGDYLTLPDDPSRRLIVAVHCYEPYEYTLEAQYPEWGHTGTVGKKHKNGENELLAQLDNVVALRNSWGVPVYIGEFGCVHRDDQRAEAFRKYYLQYYCKAASDRKLPIIYWDNGASGSGREQSGLFNRSTGSFLNNGEEIVNAMTRGYYSPSLTLNGVYVTAPK